MLSAYMKYWGYPLRRTICTGKEGCVEVYEFPPKDGGVYRFATIGVSSQSRPCNCLADWELLLCLPEGLGGCEPAVVVNYLLDIMVYTLGPDVEIGVGTLIPESPLAPASWTTKAILFDEARGEPEEITSICIGKQDINLLWLIPVTGAEYNLVKLKGFEEFDRIEAECDVSLLDVNRKGIV